MPDEKPIRLSSGSVHCRSRSARQAGRLTDRIEWLPLKGNENCTSDHDRCGVIGRTGETCGTAAVVAKGPGKPLHRGPTPLRHFRSPASLAQSSRRTAPERVPSQSLLPPHLSALAPRPVRCRPVYASVEECNGYPCFGPVESAIASGPSTASSSSWTARAGRPFTARNKPIDHAPLTHPFILNPNCDFLWTVINFDRKQNIIGKNVFMKKDGRR
jgi:hypothetical protein